MFISILKESLPGNTKVSIIVLLTSAKFERPDNMVLKAFIQLLRLLCGMSKHSIQVQFLKFLEVSLSHLNYQLPHSVLRLYRYGVN